VKVSENFGPSEIQNCVKCTELELRLHQVLDELNSVQLIVQMLRKEFIYEDFVSASIQQTGLEQAVNDTWEEMIIRGPKKNIEGKMKHIKLKEQIATSNHYAALETENKMSGNVTNLKTVSVNKPKIINNMQLGNKIYTEQDRLMTDELREETNVKTKIRHKLQNPSLTYQ
jgi:hypothetical protein